MIYLIDDKVKRQNSYGWNSTMISTYGEILQSMNTHAEFIEFSDFITEGALNHDDIFLIHDSFFANGEEVDGGDWSRYRTALNDFSQSHPEFLLVFFSGSVSGMRRTGNTLTIPVSRFYSNLSFFIDSALKGNRDIRYLMFGPNPLLEEELLQKIDKVRAFDDHSEATRTDSTILFFKPFERNIIEPFAHGSCKEITLFDTTEDKDISIKLKDWIDREEYDGIFIPISYGALLCDFSGLRLAMHIRCSPLRNRNKPIFIYSFVDHSYLIQHPLYDILKTKNVFLIGYTRKAIQDALHYTLIDMPVSDLPQEIRKVHMSLPDEYDDSHRLSNEWAIMRWSTLLGISDEPSIDKIHEKVQHDLYFKYLNTVHAISEDDAPNLKLKDHQEGLAVLYVDDDAYKGWDKVMQQLVSKCFPKWTYTCLSRELRGLDRSSIVDMVTQRVKEMTEQEVILILDFRLHEDDTTEVNPKNITGVKVLDAIKFKLNKGIQVIMFSATDKIANFEAFRYNSDAFIAKESPWAGMRSTSTTETISLLIDRLNSRSKYAYLKGIWSLKERMKELLPEKFSTLPDFKGLKKPDDAWKAQIDGIRRLIVDELDAMFEILNSDNKSRFNHAMIILFKIYEYFTFIFYKEQSFEQKDTLSELLTGQKVACYDCEKTREFVKLDPEHPEQFRVSIQRKKPNIGYLNSTKNKACFLHYKKHGSIDHDLYMSIITLANKRNDYIHPPKKKTSPLGTAKLTKEFANLSSDEPLSIHSKDIQLWMEGLYTYVHDVFAPYARREANTP